MSEQLQEFPKWVVPHDSHVLRKMEGSAPVHISAPEWPEIHVNRVDGVVTVLVNSQQEEARALADVTPEPVVEETHAETEAPAAEEPASEAISE